MGIGHGQRRSERPGTRGCGVAVCIEAFAIRSPLSGRVHARENFLSRAVSGSLHILMNRTPACGVCRSDRKQADNKSDADNLHRMSPSMIALGDRRYGLTWQKQGKRASLVKCYA